MNDEQKLAEFMNQFKIATALAQAVAEHYAKSIGNYEQTQKEIDDLAKQYYEKLGSIAAQE